MSAGNSAETAAKNVPGRPFKPGQSGNPKGRPKIPKELRAIAKAAPDKIKGMIEDPNTPAKVRADLLKWSFEMIYGKPQQQVGMDINSIPQVIFKGEDNLAD